MKLFLIKNAAGICFLILISTVHTVTAGGQEVPRRLTMRGMYLTLGDMQN
jgi:hypothetical protein